MHILAEGDEGAPPLIHNSWDWLDTIPHPIVRDQGAYAACVSCATVAMIEARHWIRNRSPIRLVPGYIHHCMFGISDVDTSVDPEAALERIRDDGVALGENDHFPVADVVCASSNLYQIQDCGWVVGRNAILNELVQRGPILTTMRVEEPSFRNAGDEVYVMPGGGQAFDHAILLLGYDAEAGWVRFLNSFGPGWCEGGVGRARFGSGGLFVDYSAAAAIVH